MGLFDKLSSVLRRDSPERSHRKRSRSPYLYKNNNYGGKHRMSRSPSTDHQHDDHRMQRSNNTSKSNSSGNSPKKPYTENIKYVESLNNPKYTDTFKDIAIISSKPISDTTKQDRLSRFKKLAESRKLASLEKQSKDQIGSVSLKIADKNISKSETKVLSVFHGFSDPLTITRTSVDNVSDEIDPLDDYMSNLGSEYQSESYFISETGSNNDTKSVELKSGKSNTVTIDDIISWSNNNDEYFANNTQEDEFLTKLREKSRRDVRATIDTIDASERYFSDEEEEPKEVNDINYYEELIGKVRTKRELPRVDHSTISYPPFNKNFYIQVSAITAMKEHEVDSFRKANGNIRIRGKKCPRPIYSFSQCGLPDSILSLLQKREYEKPFPIQMQCIPALMCGRDVIAIAETGSGKTLAFLLPAIRHAIDQPKLRENDGMIVLIIAPTRELTIQISSESSKLCKSVGLKSLAVYGGAGIGEQVNSLKRGAEIVCGTPGRLIDVLTISNGKVTNLKRVTFLVLDEADRMFDMGFSPQIMAIVDNIRPDRQTALFSATFPPSIETLAKKILTKPLQIIVGERGKSASQVDQHVIVLQENKKLFFLLKLLGEWHEHGSVIIFVNRQLNADELFSELLKYGYECAVLHGGQDQTDREFTLQDFRDGVKNILIATSIAARGIDVKSVVLVINYAAPDHFEDYVHRVGRTGRAGNFGTSYTFLTPEEASKAHDIIRALKLANQDIPEDLLQLAQGYLTTVDGKQRPRGGFGGKGFKFTESEKSRQQKERKTACQALGFTNAEDEECEEFTQTPQYIPQSAISALQNAKEVAKQFEKSCTNQPTPMIKGLSCAGYIDASSGNTIDEFDINSFPESVRAKITNKDVLTRVSETANVVLKVKGCYIPQDTAVRNLARLSGTKGLYIEITGSNVFSVQRAIKELKVVVQTITMNQLNQLPNTKQTGRYSVL